LHQADAVAHLEKLAAEDCAFELGMKVGMLYWNGVGVMRLLILHSQCVRQAKIHNARLR